MGFFSFGRIVGAFFNQLFRWLFWNKTGQKILFVIVIAFILVAFVKLGEVAAVEPDNFDTYEEIDFDGSLSNTIIGTNGVIASTPSIDWTTYYIELNPYNYYLVSSTSSSSIRSGFCNSLDAGTSVIDYIYNGTGTSDRQFNGNSYKYFIVSFANAATTSYNLYYNAYPYEVTPLSSYLTRYGSILKYIYSSSDSDFKYNTWYFPVKAGNSYRVLSQGNLLTGNNSVGFVSNLDSISAYMLEPASNEYYDIRVDIASFSFSGSDFVAPADGFIVLPGYKGIASNNYHSYTDFTLFAASNPVAIDNSSSTINTNINQSTSAINEVNSSLTDSSISDNNDDYDLPESGVTDIAESGFANIFDKLRTAFTTESSGQGLVVQVPFTDKSFNISKNTVFGNAQLGIVGTLINSFWYFCVSLWIVKDIAHKINMIKSGNIELAQTSNIKEDLL